MRIKDCACTIVLGITLTSGVAHADTDHNLQIMIDAARQLSWDEWMGNNLAYLLVKQETLLAPVAVIFGYADNAIACEGLANALSHPSAMSGTFKCQPIF